MVIVIRNRTGLDLFLAGSADERSFRIRITLDRPAPAKGFVIVLLRAGDIHGIPGCPEGLAVRIRAGESIRVVRQKHVIDGLDEDNEPTGPETYLEVTLHLLN